MVPLVTAPNWYTWGIAWVQSLQCLILQRMKLTLVNRWRIVRPLRYLAKCLPTSCRRKWCSSKFFFFHSDITCHHCTSNVSFADCARKQTEVSCTLPRNRCVKLKYSNRGNYQKFYKGCAATEECKVTSDKSFVECCDDNLCNKGNYNFSFFFHSHFLSFIVCRFLFMSLAVTCCYTLISS